MNLPPEQKQAKSIYIAYKYRYMEDKETLKRELQDISDTLSSLGHNVFILGRDVQEWKSHRHSKFSTLKDIINNIGKHNVLFVYLNSDVHSNGIPVEFALAKIYNLATIVARKNTIKRSAYEKLADKSFVFNDISDLEGKIKEIF